MINLFFSFENRAFCEIMLKNFVQPDRPQMTIWRMRIASFVSKSTYIPTRTLEICYNY
jgi:hypothetical protein